MPHTKNGSCPLSISWHPVMKMSFSVNVVSVLLRLLQETLWIFSVSLFFAARHIFQLLLTQVMPAENGGLLSRMVRPLSLASVGGGADGLMIEVHNNPEAALCDGAQSLKPEKYDVLLQQVRQIAEVVGKKF